MHRSTHRTTLALFTAVLLVSVATALAQDTFTPHHVARMRVVTAVAAAPDGSAVAYVRSVPRIPFEEEDGAAWTELHVATRDGESRAYVAGKVNVSAIRWTPDGRGIAFLARRTGDTARALYVVPRDGGESRRILTHSTDITAFDISPDGRQVAFIARDAPPSGRAELARQGFTQEIFEEALQSPRIWVTTIDLPAATAGSPRLIDVQGAASFVQWNGDGSRLVALYAPTPLVDDDLMQRRVHVLDAAAGTVVTRIDNPGKVGQVGWSPDGSTIAIISAADINDPSEGRLMVVPASGGALRDLLPDYDAHVRGFAWVDPSTIVYMSDEGVESVVGEVRTDGRGRTARIPAGSAIFTAMDRASDGSLALLASTPGHPAEVYAWRQGDAAPRRLTTSNDWLDTMRLAPQEVVRFKARDGLELEGMLIRPLDARAGERYPLILNVHGGPEARDANGWLTTYSNLGQVAAANGFAIFYPNYRGSTGRGVAFSKLGQGDAAGKEFDDLVDAVDHLIAIGLVDRDKVGITGGSYGGYASAWGATYYTERFAAAVPFVGISNKVSKVGTTDISNEEYHVHARKRPWDDWQFTLERSPVYHAGKSRTPTLILHGTADPRVHPTQSLELYRHLKLHGNTPVRLVWYPGEGHGNARAASRLDYSLRVLQRFTHYLKGPGGDPPPSDLPYRPAAGSGPVTHASERGSAYGL